MLSCSIWFSAPSFWSRCVGRVYGADGAVMFVLSLFVRDQSLTFNNGQLKL